MREANIKRMILWLVYAIYWIAPCATALPEDKSTCTTMVDHTQPSRGDDSANDLFSSPRAKEFLTYWENMKLEYESWGSIVDLGAIADSMKCDGTEFMHAHKAIEDPNACSKIPTDDDYSMMVEAYVRKLLPFTMAPKAQTPLIQRDGGICFFETSFIGGSYKQTLM